MLLQAADHIRSLSLSCTGPWMTITGVRAAWWVHEASRAVALILGMSNLACPPDSSQRL